MTAPLRRNGLLISTIARGCEAKLRFSDEFGARAAGQHDGERYQTRMFIYPCKNCRGWHLTTKRQSRRDRAADYQFSSPPR